MKIRATLVNTSANSRVIQVPFERTICINSKSEISSLQRKRDLSLSLSLSLFLRVRVRTFG